MSLSDGWTVLCRLEELQPRIGKAVAVGTLTVAVFRIDEQTVRVIDDTCPHAGASLATGHVEDRCVICPWHAWCFDLHNGRMPDAPHIFVPSFAVRIENGRVLADLRQPLAMEPLKPPGFEE